MSDHIPISQSAIMGAINSIKPEEPKEDRETVNERKIAGLEGNDGWQLLKKEMKQRIKELRAINMTDTDTIESIGYKYLASQGAIANMQWVIDRVEQTRKAIGARENQS